MCRGLTMKESRTVRHTHYVRDSRALQPGSGWLMGRGAGGLGVGAWRQSSTTTEQREVTAVLVLSGLPRHSMAAGECLLVYLSIYLSIYLFIYLYVCMYVCLSVCLPPCLHVYMSISSHLPVCLTSTPLLYRSSSLSMHRASLPGSSTRSRP